MTTETVSASRAHFDGDALRRLRLGKRWSWEEVGRRLSVSRQQVKRWEDGLNEPRYGQVVAIAELFGLSTDYFDKSRRK